MRVNTSACPKGNSRSKFDFITYFFVKVFKIDNVQYNGLYAFDAFPNIIFCFTAGYIINDKLLGLHKTMLLVVGAMVVG